MADYEVEDYQEYTEDEAFQETFGDYGDDEDEGEYYSRSFDTMSPDDREKKFGDIEFTELINELEEVLNNSRKFFFKNKRIIDALYFGGIIDDIRDRTPAEIEKGIDIINRESDIIRDAENEADRITTEANTYDAEKRSDADAYYDERVAEGNAEKDRIIEEALREAERLTSEHQITMNAREQGKQIIDSARQEAQGIINSTNASVSEYKDRLNEWADKSMNDVIQFCFTLLQETRQVATSNIVNIDETYQKTRENLSRVKTQLGTIR